MRSDPSGADKLGGEGSLPDDVATGGTAAGSSVDTLSRNVADGTKNKFPVTARLKSSIRS